MATYSASFAAANQPRIVADPATVDIFQSYLNSATSSAADVIHMLNLKVPHGATILDVRAYTGVVDGSHGIKFGITGGITSAGLFGSASFSSTTKVTALTAAGVLPYKVSVSDDATTRYVIPTVTFDAATSGTLSVSVGVRITYTMNKCA